MNKRSILVLGAVVLVVALLAGAAFMAVRLLNGKDPFEVIGLGAGGNGWSIHEKPSPELPKQKADLSGLVTSVKDNSFFVAPVSNVNAQVINGVGQQQPTPAGPSAEVVVVKDTKIWRDVTMDHLPTPSANSSHNVEVQQELETADISAITANPGSYVEVWGQKRGERWIADVIVGYSQ